ncbi:type 1 glutamine amidotransferase [Bdellovibrionota bacterium FG-2]
MKILIIDNNIDRDSWSAPSLARFARKVSGATLSIRRAPQDDLPRDPLAFDRFVLSGSRTSAMEDAPWIDHLIEFLQKVMSAGKPILGVCYGHQILARALGGKDAVRKADRAEFGWTQIKVHQTSPLTQGLPKSFYSFASHHDEVCTLPKGMKPLASSDWCQVQAFQIGDSPTFGIQFHPEKTIEDGHRIYEIIGKSYPTIPLLNPTRSEELFDPLVGDTLFANFFSL